MRKKEHERRLAAVEAECQRRLLAAAELYDQEKKMLAATRLELGRARSDLTQYELLKVSHAGCNERRKAAQLLVDDLGTRLSQIITLARGEFL